MENRERLIPIVGSEEALGGPHIMGIRKTHPVPKGCSSVTFLRFLLDHGLDPWATAADGSSALTCCAWSKECVDILMSLPGFNVNFVDPMGRSLLDHALGANMTTINVVSALLDINCPVTESTPKLVRSALFDDDKANIIRSTKVRLRIVERLPPRDQNDLARP